MTLLSLVEEVAGNPRGLMRIEFLDRTDLTHQLLQAIWSSEPPVELVPGLRKWILRCRDTVRQQQRRRLKRTSSANVELLPSPDPSDQHLNHDLLAAAAQSESDQQILEAELHNDFAKLATSGKLGSRTRAYKARSALHSRIQQLAK